MGYFANDKGSIISDWFVLEGELSDYEIGKMVDIALFDDHIRIKEAHGKGDILTLKYSQITDVFHGKKKDIINSKSVIGQAMLGGMLFGKTGAVIGALSASDKETKKFFIISYIGKDGEEHVIKTIDSRNWHGKQLAQKLRELSGFPEVQKKSKRNRQQIEL